MIYYKVRDKATGLYHKGGVYSVWSKTGKTWTTLGKLRSMLTMNINNGTSMSDWEIIEYEVVEKTVKSVNDVIDPKKLIQYIKGK
jgi:hypothetical protein